MKKSNRKKKKIKPIKEKTVIITQPEFSAWKMIRGIFYMLFSFCLALMVYFNNVQFWANAKHPVALFFGILFLPITGLVLLSAYILDIMAGIRMIKNFKFHRKGVTITSAILLTISVVILGFCIFDTVQFFLMLNI